MADDGARDERRGDDDPSFLEKLRAADRARERRRWAGEGDDDASFLQKLHAATGDRDAEAEVAAERSDDLPEDPEPAAVTEHDEEPDRADRRDQGARTRRGG